MDIIKGLIRTISFWIFIVVAVLGGIGTVYPLPFIGVIIAALTILGVSLQGAETVRAQKELDRKHQSVLQEIEQARQEAAKQYTEATQEIYKTKEDALFLIKWVTRMLLFIYSVSDNLIAPTVLRWIRRRNK